METLSSDLCDEKFDQEMNTVDLVDINVRVKAEEDASPSGKRRGRPKKGESPALDGMVI